MRYLRLTGRQRRLTWLVLAVLLTAGLGCAAVLHMRPIIVSLATARVSNAVNRIVVDAVRDAIDSGQVDYNVLIHLEKDETGRVAALESNMAAFNRLRSQIADEILRRLSEVSTSELSIPVGTLTGSAAYSSPPASARTGAPASKTPGRIGRLLPQRPESPTGRFSGPFSRFYVSLQQSPHH